MDWLKGKSTTIDFPIKYGDFPFPNVPPIHLRKADLLFHAALFVALLLKLFFATSHVLLGPRLSSRSSRKMSIYPPIYLAKTPLEEKITRLKVSSCVNRSKEWWKILRENTLFQVVSGKISGWVSTQAGHRALSVPLLLRQESGPRYLLVLVVLTLESSDWGVPVFDVCCFSWDV